ncbi:Der1-like family-domain-containing protein [Mycotypha africana]|uniref:Der1-like family-domain-containing protein n=1 Tax=Mycotypha africana TaxID=64632 RepID=UPI0023017C3D|nr:Der1-like family-domain-containing protein [Mycotypha africana]KAI8987450.1 Der1-like family-domain-containing protein [Mycotypha africana]
MVYIWSRRNPYIRLNFLGILVFSASFLPWVLLLFSIFLNGQIPTGDILGMLVGHIYYFLEDVWPRDPMSHGKKWIKTPRIIRWLVEGNRPRDDSIGIGDATEDNEFTEEVEPDNYDNTVDTNIGNEQEPSSSPSNSTTSRDISATSDTHDMNNSEYSGEQKAHLPETQEGTTLFTTSLAQSESSSSSATAPSYEDGSL